MKVGARAALGAALLLAVIVSGVAAASEEANDDYLVTTTGDSGEGSLRQAILNANSSEGVATISFDSETGPFGEPQTITLAGELPPLQGEIVIDGYISDKLWKASGVTVSGGGKNAVFRVERGSRVIIRHLTIGDGRAENGGGIANEGNLVVRGVTFSGNEAKRDGGGVVSLDGTLTAINSTFAGNGAGSRGGGIAVLGGAATVTNCTFSGNSADRGGGIFNSGRLLLRNTIVANSEGGGDCVSEGILDPAGTRNLIEANEGCGVPISTEDPDLEPLGYFNGSTKTFPIGGGSPAINLGDNASAVDENGEPLPWDQRGNGDPRIVSGIVDIGAFEWQRHSVIMVDTVEDSVLRGCTMAGPDCPLRGAIEIANAAGEPAIITFDPDVFREPQTIALTRPLPELAVDVTFNALDTATVTVKTHGKSTVFSAATGVKVRLENVIAEP